MHWNSRITLCLILLYCCVPIQSHPRGLPHVLFLLLYVAVCVHRAYPVYCRVLCTCHNNMYPDPPQRKSFGHLFFLVCRFFCLFTFFAVPLDVPTTSKCIQLNSTYENCVAVAVSMSTYEGCCCTYDLQDSPSWLLLLLIVDQLVYRAVLLLCYIYHPAHAFYFKKMKNVSCEYD